MRNNYTCTTIYFAATIFAFMLIVCVCFPVQPVSAQTFYRAVSASQVDMVSISSNAQSNEQIKSEGSYLIKDGVLDEIYNMRLTLPTTKLASQIGNRKITFEQTRVMVLPIMGMVHLVGILDVDGAKSVEDFQLGFTVNSDQSITFKGTKLFNLNDLDKELPKNELKLAVDFVLKNNKNNLVVLNGK